MYLRQTKQYIFSFILLSVENGISHDLGRDKAEEIDGWKTVFNLPLPPLICHLIILLFLLFLSHYYFLCFLICFWCCYFSIVEKKEPWLFRVATLKTARSYVFFFLCFQSSFSPLQNSFPTSIKTTHGHTSIEHHDNLFCYNIEKMSLRIAIVKSHLSDLCRFYQRFSIVVFFFFCCVFFHWI